MTQMKRTIEMVCAADVHTKAVKPVDARPSYKSSPATLEANSGVPWDESKPRRYRLGDEHIHRGGMNTRDGGRW